MVLACAVREEHKEQLLIHRTTAVMSCLCADQLVSYFKFHTKIQIQANNRRVFVILVSSKAAEFKAVQRACAGCRLGVKSLFGLQGKQK